MKLVAFFGSIAVILGAFGAHTLQNLLTEKQLAVYKTGIDYQFWHTLALFGTYLLAQKWENHSAKAILWSQRFFILGICCFSGSLYLLACRDLLSIPTTLIKIIGPITPIGGMFFIFGWASLFFAIQKTSE
jgi:uncharacterized membrane protein YgdD (TMEM256/DUF423 family)